MSTFRVKDLMIRVVRSTAGSTDLQCNDPSCDPCSQDDWSDCDCTYCSNGCTHCTECSGTDHKCSHGLSAEFSGRGQETSRMGLSDLAILKRQLQSQLAEVERRQEQINAALRPQTPEQLEFLEQKLEESLAEVRVMKASKTREQR